MKAAIQASVAMRISALTLVLATCPLGTAEAQQNGSAARRPKVSTVTRASYDDDDAEPAPEMSYHPTSVSSNSSFNYPRGTTSSPLQAIPAQASPAQNNPTYNNRSQGNSAPRNAQARFGGTPRSGRSANHYVAQRNSAPPANLLPTPAPAREQVLLPTPNPTMASVHPMDNPFDDMDMPMGSQMEGPMDDQMMDGSMMGGPAGGCCNNNCGGGQCGGCAQCCCLLGPWLWDNFSVFGGVQGFKNPVDLGTNGNFGFHAGINWAFPILDPCGIGFQVGTQGVFSDLSGTTTSSDTRTQNFTTLGLFHRPACGVGPQYGVAWDYMHDDYSRATVDLSQVRGEISLIGCRGNEIGFWTAIHTNSQSIRDTGTQVAVVERTYQATDMYALFYRRHFCNGGWARFSGGFTNNSEGLIGADAMAPLTQCLALNTNFNYRIPNEATDAANARQEAWGLTINLVWYPACSRMCGGGSAGPNPYRPLFGVADNTTMILDRQ